MRRDAFRRGRRVIPCATVVLLVASLAGCGSPATTASATPTATTAKTPSVLTPIVGENSATPTQFAVGGTGKTVGVGDICASPKSVDEGLPATVPSYPGADLRQGYSEQGGSTFGLCAQAAVGDIVTFYVGKLPGNGWQDVKSTTLPSSSQQVTATRSGESLAITLLPDSSQPGSTNVLIVISNQ